jgi:hypothetical protein
MFRTRGNKCIDGQLPAELVQSLFVNNITEPQVSLLLHINLTPVSVTFKDPYEFGKFSITHIAIVVSSDSGRSAGEVAADGKQILRSVTTIILLRIVQ